MPLLLPGQEKQRRVQTVDNNNSQPADEATKPNPVITESEDHAKDNKMIIRIVLGMVLIVLMMGGIYWYVSNNQKASTQVQTQPEISNSTNKKASTTSVDSLEKNANSIDVQSADADFTDLDTDLKSL